MSLPPEILLRTFGTEVGEIELDGDIDAQLRMVCLCRPILRGIAPSVDELTPFLHARILHHLMLYREFIRPLLLDGRVFHHTPFQPLAAHTPWCVLEYADARGTHAVSGIFRTTDSDVTVYRFLPRGLDRARHYTVTLDNSGQTYQAEGHALMQDGILIRLERSLSSEMVLIRAEEDE